MNPNLKKVILGGGILILVLVLGYLLYKQFNGGISFTKSSSTETSTLKSTISNEPINSVTTLVATTNNSVVTDEIVEQLKKVSTITLSTTLINSTSFNTLLDLSTALPEDTSTGRRNPFASK